MKIACRRNPLLSFCQTSPSPDIINNNNNTLQTTKLFEGQNHLDNKTTVLTNKEDLSLLSSTTLSTIQSPLSMSKINFHENISSDDEGALPPKIIDNKTHEEMSGVSSEEVGWKFSTLIDGNTGTNKNIETKKKQKLLAIDNENGDESIKSNNNSRHSGSNDDSGFGSLLRLPKPALGHDNKKDVNHSITNTTLPLSSRNETEPPTSMLVFVTKYCIDQRITFKKNCLGKKIDNDHMDLCKNYPLACQGREQIMPVIYYCDKFEIEYDNLCQKKNVVELGKVNDILRVMNFCSTYPTICIDKSLEHDPIVIRSPPKNNYVRCKDIKEKAKKLCNPLPDESDILNHVKCNQFIKNCKEFVDWL
ncbi:Hypothetical protein SRAE_2000066400 [Strongyloides ratti]|uniref:Uncharacterized protein n=1 Tax=Strongyloides ratti TaxID=34506 RepID=A0A090LEM4_STRRB|nr:Hypothetical protein SRAE_2000066400 [Strongyloides ratti]CEF65990.1 Hypothetical protein SRAE_2000066400 [Strongyloides ratti]